MLDTRLGADNGSCPFYYKKENEYKNGNPHILHFGILIFALENAFLVKCISRIPKLYSKHDFFFFFSKYIDYLVKYILTIDIKHKIPPNKFCCL